jgi:hypothetical protein
MRDLLATRTQNPAPASRPDPTPRCTLPQRQNRRHLYRLLRLLQRAVRSGALELGKHQDNRQGETATPQAGRARIDDQMGVDEWPQMLALRWNTSK